MFDWQHLRDRDRVDGSHHLLQTRAGIVTVVPHWSRTPPLVALADWSRNEEADTGRAKRLAGSYAVAAGLVGAVLVVGVVFGGQIKKQVLEEEVNVKFVAPEPVKAAPPPPPPPPPPQRVATNTNRPKLGSVTDAPPTEIPKGPPAEGDPNRPKEAGPDGVGDPNGCVGCTGKGGPPAKPVETAPPAPPPPPAPPLQVAEVSTPAMITSKTMPAYPEDARKQGIEAVVVVKLIIDDAGRLEDVKIAKGHPLFDDVVLAAIRTWTFEPATLDGKPVRMAKLVKIPFRLKAT
jgi:periplasmic protein TonB